MESFDPTWKPSKLVQEELDRVNTLWNNLLQNVHGKENINRVKIILTQVMIEYYLDRVLLIREIDTSDNIYKMRFDTILEKLKENQIIHEDFEYDLLRIYKIRNIYSHEIEIHDNQVLDLLNGFKTIKDPKRFAENERLDKMIEIILTGVQRMFMQELVRNERI